MYEDVWVCMGEQVWTLETVELEALVSRLDAEMELELEAVRGRYARKRQPILDAMHLKRKRQQNF